MLHMQIHNLPLNCAMKCPTGEVNNLNKEEQDEAGLEVKSRRPGPIEFKNKGVMTTNPNKSSDLGSAERDPIESGLNLDKLGGKRKWVRKFRADKIWEIRCEEKCQERKRIIDTVDASDETCQKK
ncbi:hypothetical protein Q3G72_026237 [Acer saccharum]|nr:hypothetical protein Q3G72_026237 [Acer saccharum]